MLNWILGVLGPLVIHLGVEAVLARFPNLPGWVITILKELEGAKQAAADLPCKAEREAAVAEARARAGAKLHAGIHGGEIR